MGDAGTTSGAGIPRMPGIDGLRALAVGGVVMFHLPAVGLVGGYLAWISSW